jgi:hypothetical protein
VRHLYLQIYAALVAALILFGVLVFATWLLLPPSEQRQKLMTGGAAVLSDLLPAKERPIAETQAALDRLYRQLNAGLSLYSADGELLAFAGEQLPAPDLSKRTGGWTHGGGKARGSRCGWSTDAGWWCAHAMNIALPGCGSLPCLLSPWPSAPTPLFGASRGGSNACRDASINWAPGI